jgi:UPF0176 protein
MKFLNIAFYRFQELQELPSLRAELRAFCRSRGIRGTILLSTEGINGSLAGEEASVRALQGHLEARIGKMDHKESWSEAIPFGELFVKLKKEIIPLGDPAIKPVERTGKRISPATLKTWLDEGRDMVLLDTRNTYEIEHGTFAGALDLGLRNFRNFPEKLRSLPADARAKPLVMFCTGGIRCEKASVVALDQGFPEVLQLDGGILRYFDECGGSHYQGKCFVFDDRIAVEPPRK